MTRHTTTRRQIVRRVIAGWTLPTGGTVDVVEIAAVTRDRRDVHGIEVLARDPGVAVPRELLRAVTPREIAGAPAADGASGRVTAAISRFPIAWWITRLRDAVDEAAAQDGGVRPRATSDPAATLLAESSDVLPARIRRGGLALLA